MEIKRTGRILIVMGAALMAVSCGGKQSIASKSAAAYREAVAKGIPVGSGGHGGHTAKSEVTATAANMPGMFGMDQSQMQHGSSQSMASVPGMQSGAMAGMDHSKMQHGSAKTMANMPGMQHGTMAGMSNMAGMRHGSSHSMANMPGMGMQHGSIAVAPVPPAPTNSSGIGRLDPAATLKTDDFDQPSPLAVSEANKAKPPGGTKE